MSFDIFTRWKKIALKTPKSWFDEVWDLVVLKCGWCSPNFSLDDEPSLRLDSIIHIAPLPEILARFSKSSQKHEALIWWALRFGVEIILSVKNTKALIWWALIFLPDERKSHQKHPSLDLMRFEIWCRWKKIAKKTPKPWFDELWDFYPMKENRIKNTKALIWWCLRFGVEIILSVKNTKVLIW